MRTWIWGDKEHSFDTSADNSKLWYKAKDGEVGRKGEKSKEDVLYSINLSKGQREWSL